MATTVVTGPLLFSCTVRAAEAPPPSDWMTGAYRLVWLTATVSAWVATLPSAEVACSTRFSVLPLSAATLRASLTTPVPESILNRPAASSASA